MKYFFAGLVSAEQIRSRLREPGIGNRELLLQPTNEVPLCRHVCPQVTQRYTAAEATIRPSCFWNRDLSRACPLCIDHSCPLLLPAVSYCCCRCLSLLHCWGLSLHYCVFLSQSSTAVVVGVCISLCHVAHFRQSILSAADAGICHLVYSCHAPFLHIRPHSLFCCRHTTLLLTPASVRPCSAVRVLQWSVSLLYPLFTALSERMVGFCLIMYISQICFCSWHIKNSCHTGCDWSIPRRPCLSLVSPSP